MFLSSVDFLMKCSAFYSSNIKEVHNYIRFETDFHSDYRFDTVIIELELRFSSKCRCAAACTQVEGQKLSSANQKMPRKNCK